MCLVHYRNAQDHNSFAYPRTTHINTETTTQIHTLSPPPHWPTLTNVHVFTATCAFTLMHLLTHSFTHISTQTYLHMHFHTCTHGHPPTQSHRLTHKCIPAHIPMHAYTHWSTHTCHIPNTCPLTAHNHKIHSHVFTHACKHMWHRVTQMSRHNQFLSSHYDEFSNDMCFLYSVSSACLQIIIQPQLLSDVSILNYRSCGCNKTENRFIPRGSRTLKTQNDRKWKIWSHHWTGARQEAVNAEAALGRELEPVLRISNPRFPDCIWMGIWEWVSSRHQIFVYLLVICDSTSMVTVTFRHVAGPKVTMYLPGPVAGPMSPSMGLEFFKQEWQFKGKVQG
jgi:hypothetical protein